MREGSPLSTLLSRTLLVFTIEFDNQFERQIMASPYRPFLVSMVMWSNFLRFVPTDGIKVRDLSAAAGLAKPVHPSLAGMERWGYVKVDRDPADQRAKPPRADWIVTPGLAGQKAAEIWSGLATVIEGRWRERFGGEIVDQLGGSLRTIVGRIESDLPRYPPVLYSKDLRTEVDERPATDPVGSLDLPALISKPLVAFTMDYERVAETSLVLAANVVRVIDGRVPVREMPVRSGVSKEAISMAFTSLSKNGYLVVEPDGDDPRTKVALLTERGHEIRATHVERLAGVEGEWRSRFGPDAIDRLRSSLDQLLDHPQLSEGLVPPDDGWRAKKPYVTQTKAFVESPLTALPHYPMVLHRGGWPDGS